MPKVTQEKVETVMLELRDSLNRCEEDFKLLIEDMDHLKEKMEKEQKVLGHTQSGRAALVELELADEPAYNAVLEIFNTVSSRLLTRDLAQIKYSKKPQAEWRKNILKMGLTQRKLRFLQDVAHVNAELVDYAFEERVKELESPAVSKDEKMVLPLLAIEKMKSIFPKDAVDPSKNGLWRTYYDSGVLKSETNYKAGVLDGSSVFYSETGALVSESIFKAGMLEGERSLYYSPAETGKQPSKYSDQQFSKGLPHGKQLYYYENGNLKTEMEYDHGQLVGEVKLYAPGGKLTRKVRVGAQ